MLLKYKMEAGPDADRSNMLNCKTLDLVQIEVFIKTKIYTIF